MKVLGLVLAVVALAIFTRTAIAQEGDQTGSWARPFLEYEASKADPWGPFVLNLLLGFGVGSFVQGDTTGGLMLVGAEAIGIGLVLAGGVNFFGERQALVYGGFLLSGVARLAGIAFPFTYANAFNQKLRRDLGILVSSVSLNEHGLNFTLTTDLH